MAFEAVGKLHTSYETKQISERFTKREFVVEIADGKYPQFVLFQLTGDRCGQLDGYQVGDSVRVTFNVRGREWRNPQGEVKYFNSLDVWKLEGERRAGDTPRRGRPEPQYDAAPPRSDEPRPSDLAGPGRDDDIPF